MSFSKTKSVALAMLLTGISVMSCEAQVSDPAIVTSGINNSSQTVTVTVTDTTSGATIRYSTDGTLPTASSSFIASGATLTFSQSTVLRIVAISGTSFSNLITASYAFAGTISSSGDHATVINKDGTISSWGNNTSGQLGVGNTTSANLPKTTQISSGTAFTGAYPERVLTTSVNYQLYDGDGNGLPDWWEINYFGYTGTVTGYNSNTIDANGLTLLQDYTQGVTPTLGTYNASTPVISSPTTASGTMGTSFSYTITASHSPTTYGVTGTLPGLSLNSSTGVISGTPTGAGTYVVTLVATNSNGTGTARLTLTINTAVPIITSVTAASATVGVPFSYSITARNTPTSFSASGLPSGLSVNTGTGIISGTLTTAGITSITLGAANSGGSATPVTLTLTTTTPPIPVITSGTTVTGDVGVLFSYTITASNGPTSFSASGLPSGLTLNASTGVISGTPTSPGTWTITLGASNGGGSSSPVSLSITVNSAAAPVITSGLMTYGVYGTPFSYTITATNTPTSYAATGLPAGLSVNTSTGVISGTPTSTTTATVMAIIKATKSSETGSATLVFNINPPAPVISSATTATAYVGTGFSFAVVASNAPLSFAATGLPAGLSIDSTTGVIFGTPLAASSSTVTLSATNPGGTGTTTLSLTVVIPLPVPVINSPTAATGVNGSPFSYAITTATAVGTASSYSASGLPSGLNINTSTGLILGTPITTGTYTATLGASNIWGTGTETLSLTINAAGSPMISSSTTATGMVGSAFSYSIIANNTPTSFSATGLPGGLSVNTSTGVISGTPTSTGVFIVNIRAGNTIGTGVSNVTLTVTPPVPIINSATTASGTFGTPIVPYRITASSSPTSYVALGLPPGLYIDTSSGIIAGTPTMSGIYIVTLKAINAGGPGSADSTFTIASWNSQPISTRAVAAGNYETLVLKSDGTVWTKGYNFDGELGYGGTATSDSYVKVSGLTGIVAIASEGSTCLALKSDGTVWTWGYNVDGELGNGSFIASSTPVEVSTGTGPLTGIIAIAGGGFFGLALKSDGTVWSWGWDSDGQLGNGDNTYASSSVAVQVSGLTNVTSIGCGGFHGLATKSDGTVWCWGANEAGELGNGTTTNSNVPVKVLGLPAIVTGLEVAVGVTGGGGIDSNGFSAVVLGDGTVWAWGDGNRGRLGNGTTGGYSTAPVPVFGLSGVTSICGSQGDHILALKNDGTVWAWGQNAYYGQLGNGSLVDSNVPVQVSNLTNVVGLAAGAFFSTVVKQDGTIWSWGSNADGEIGPSPQATQLSLPSTVAGLSGVIAIGGDKSHYLAVKSDGTVWTWNDTTPGLVSDGATVLGSISPVQVPGLTGITSVACGTFFNLALKSDGTVWSWGLNNHGQLGSGNYVDNQVPTQISGLSNIIAISAGGYFAMALKNDNTVLTWGQAAYGQLGNGSSSPDATSPVPISSSVLSGITAISAGGHHVVALKNDGTVWTWGANYEGELGNGTLNWTNVPVKIASFSGVTAIACEYYHSIALKSDGTLWTWGGDSDGELGIGTTTGEESPTQVSSLTGVSKISASGDTFHTVVLKSDGTVWASGSNFSGQLGQGVYGSTGSFPSYSGSLKPLQVLGLSSTAIISLACGEYSSIALKSDGTVVQWGDTSYQPVAFSAPVESTDLVATPEPTMTPPPGSYSSSQSITISTTVAGTIRYTLDGTEPTGSSTAYSGSPFALTASALVTAGVFDSSGNLLTLLAGNQYYINDSSNSGLPTAATGLNVTVISGSEIDLAWTLSGLVNYGAINIYRSSDGGTTYQLVTTLAASVTSYKDTNVNAGVSYQYYVGTVNSSGESDTSASSSYSPTSIAALTITVTTPSGATPLP